MKTNKPSRLGDLEDYKITANGKDITSAVTQCDVWQDVFVAGWSASLAMSDTANMIHQVPLKQGTEFVITLETKLNGKTDGSKEFKFVLFSIAERQLEKSRHQSYVCNLIHKDLFKNQQQRVQKYYSGTADSIVSQIIRDKLGGQVDCDSSEGNVNVIIPNWSPFIAAQWCAMHATKNKTADFMFFMCDEGKYKFKSMETMYGDDTGIKLVQRLADVRNDDASIPDDNVLAFTQFSFEHSNAIDNIAGGYFGSKTVSYDFVNKVWNEKKFKFGEDCSDDASKKNFSNDVFGESELTNIVWVPKHEGLFQGGQSIYDPSDDWCGSRKSSFMKFNQDRLFVQIPGGAKTWEWIGKSITVELSSHEDITGEKMDKYYQGQYLIVAISHQILGEEYVVTLELIKKRVDKEME